MIPERAVARRVARIARGFWRRGWMLGTSGNLSARLAGDEPRFLITASGRPKGRLGPGDFLVVGPDGQALQAAADAQPSAETAIHLAVYAASPATAAVFHVHAPYATYLSDTQAPDLELQDFEMQKGLGQSGPFGVLRVPILPNEVLATTIAEKLHQAGLGLCPGVLIRKHGLYAWGRSLDEAQTHTEIFEFLFLQFWLRSGRGSG
jgi:methylthioribulose-1-phosphate dehydratase